MYGSLSLKIMNWLFPDSMNPNRIFYRWGTDLSLANNSWTIGKNLDKWTQPGRSLNSHVFIICSMSLSSGTKSKNRMESLMNGSRINWIGILNIIEVGMYIYYQENVIHFQYRSCPQIYCH